MSNWFRETPESLRALTEERALVAEAERQEGLTLSLGQVRCEGAHSDCAPDENGRHAYTCAYCGAVV